MEPTSAQKDAILLCKLEQFVSEARWHGKTMIVPYWGAVDHFAFISEHGSVTYVPENMFEVHLAGISE